MSASPPIADDWRNQSVLIVDDEEGMRNFLHKALQSLAGTVDCVGSAEAADALLRRTRFDLVILDITLPGQSGVDWLRGIREQGFSGEVILITAFADLDTAISALRAGASDFILKPFRMPQILNAVRHCMERARLRRENFVLRRTISVRDAGIGQVVGDSEAMGQLRGTLQRLAQVTSTVLLQGESGTGKEVAARALHALSPRADRPFMPVNCAAMSADLLESELFGHAKGAFSGASHSRDGLLYYAQGGTLFLDEVAELPLSVQAALLRVLEDRTLRPIGSEQLVPVDVRILAASSRRLADEVEAGRLRKDLYYRLQVVELTLPALRTHKEDIPALVGHFNALLARQLGLAPLTVSAEEMAFLCEYDWPGNVRELRNFVERSLILGTVNVSALYPLAASVASAPASSPTAFPAVNFPLASAAPLPPASAASSAGFAAASPPAPAGTGGRPETNLHALEKRHILGVLDSVQGDKTRAAQLLGISRRTLERRCADWNTD